MFLTEIDNQGRKYLLLGLQEGPWGAFPPKGGVSTHTPGGDVLEDPVIWKRGWTFRIQSEEVVDCRPDVSMSAVSASVFLDKDTLLYLPHRYPLSGCLTLGLMSQTEFSMIQHQKQGDTTDSFAKQGIVLPHSWPSILQMWSSWKRAAFLDCRLLKLPGRKAVLWALNLTLILNEYFSANCNRGNTVYLPFVIQIHVCNMTTIMVLS